MTTQKAISVGKQGFTFIELLIVIAILGVLSSGVVVAINPAKKIAQARDAQRLMTMASIREALNEYIIFNGDYPPSSSGGVSTCTSGCGGWEVAGCGVPFIKALIDQGYLKTDIKDPTMNGSPGSCYNYLFYRYDAGSYGCDASKGDYYVLGVTDTESSNNPYSGSPGWSCSGRNWQGEFDWVVGGFQQ